MNTSKIHLTTLGCPKNVVDSEKMMAQLEAHQFEVCESAEDADVLIINTCGFINDAKEESIQAIFEALELKEKDPAKKVFVAGCLTQRYRDEIRKEIPEVDAVFGTEDYQTILKTLGTKHTAVDNILRMRRFTTPRHYAYLKISEGCDHTCSFCAIPGIRGKHRSRPIEELVDEAKRLRDGGARELILVSQDSSAYGRDLYRRPATMHLLEALHKIEYLPWLRVLYWYPTNFPKAVLDLMQEGKILPYIDMPIQHISEHMLRTMRRGDTRKSIMRLYDLMRTKIPHIALRTSLILGHPGETREDFRELLEFIKEIQFDRLGTFTYSDEEGTASYRLPHKIDEGVARERQEQIMETQRGISLKRNQQLVGSTLQVIIDEYDCENDYYVARTYRDAPEIDNEVLIKNVTNDHMNIGEFHHVKIESASEYELYAHMVLKTKSVMESQNTLIAGTKP